MKPLRQRIRGFTLLEIIVVIAVIGILASITAFGFGRFQADSRDTQRATDAAVIVEALEKYFDENGEYPSCPVITGDATTITTSVLPGIDSEVLVTPNAPASEENSIRCDDLTIDGEDFFEYEGAGGAPCTAGDACLAYTLKYVSESDNEIVELQSRRTTPLDATGTIADLSATASGFYSINLNWGSILEADGYRVEYATNDTFTADVQTTDVTENNASISGLTINTPYYFRVTQLIGGTPGNWSNEASATTRNLVAPTMSSANVASASSVTVNWNNVAYESSYTVRYSTTSGFTSNVFTIPGIAANATSRTVTGLTAGTTYYFQVRAENGALTTAWANTPALSATPIAQGSIINTSSNNCSSVVIEWAALAGAASYTIRHSASSSMSNATTIPGATGTSRTINDLPQGATRYFTVSGVTASGYTGQASTVAARLVTDCTPSCTTSTLNSNTQITISWSGVQGTSSYTTQRSTNNSTWTNTSSTTGTSQVFSGLNNGTTYYFRVQAVAGSTESSWDSCPSRATGISGPSSWGWTARPYGVRAWNAVSWMPGAEQTYGNWYTNGMYITATCSGGASPRVQLQSYYAYSNNSSPNGYRTLSWTSSTQDRYVVGGSGSWKVWWHGWVACQVGGTRVGDRYLGNAGPY